MLPKAGMAKSYWKPLVLYAVAGISFYTIFRLEKMDFLDELPITVAFLVAFSIFGLGLFLNHRDGLRRDEMFENLPKKIVDAMDERFPGLKHLPVPKKSRKKRKKKRKKRK